MADSEGPDQGSSARSTGLAALRGDCARMVPHWAAPPAAAPRPVPPALIRRIVVPPGSARLLDAMSDYGD